MSRTSRTRAVFLLSAITLGAGCTVVDDDQVEIDDETDEADVDEQPEEDFDLADEDDVGFVDLDCSPEALGEDELTEFTTAHPVIDGTLVEPCFGEDDEILLEAWDLLADITPSAQLADLALFTAFRSGEDGDEITLAFVNAVDVDGTAFQMSVNVEAYSDDLEQAQLTMAHEFAHVFTSTPAQVDRSFEASETCDTYFNGESCFLSDSLIAQWIAEFWGDGLIDEIDPGGEPTIADGQQRCDLDPGFFGAYAASDPEEDFAEAFSAYVFDVESAHPAQQERLDWIDEQPGLAEFRDRAVDAGLAPIEFEFDPCGAAG